MCSVSLPLWHFLQLGIGDEDVGGAVLAVVDEEVGLGALRQRVLARVRVRSTLRHPLSPLASLLSCCGRRRGEVASGAWEYAPRDGLRSTAVQAEATEEESA